MDDRELLEAAARAAGIQYEWHEGCGNALHLTDPAATAIFWNPLASDADALRLAVKLGIQIRQYPIYDTPRFAAYACEAKWSSDAEKNIGSEAMEKYEGDPYAATRRCIVRAAAAMAKE